MGRKKKITISPKYILIVLCSLCVILIVLSFRYQDSFAPFKTTAGTILTPMQKGINSIGRFFSAKIEMVQKIESLVNKNHKLQKELDSRNYENKILQQEKYELDELRKLYELDGQYASYPKVAARVIGRDNNNWYNQFTIDKGSEAGIKKNQNVIAGNGLVGLVYEVGKNYAKVRSIIDDDSNVSGMFQKTSDTCNIIGNIEMLSKEGKLAVEYINKDAQVEDGYEVITSHVSMKFLPGILIGYISDVELDSNQMTKVAKITPAVDFDGLETVLIIKELKDASELEDALNYDD